MTSPLTSISALFASALCVLTMVAATVEPRPATVPSTPMEAALDALRSRFPNQVGIGFEELWEARPESEPVVDLGPPNSSLQQALDRIRHTNPRYRIDLLAGGLVHVHPAHRTADPQGLLDIRLHEFFLPPDNCLQQQIDRVDSLGAGLSYTPELSQYLLKKKEEWNRNHGSPVFGIVGDFAGGHCEPSQQRRDPVYRNITVREAMNLMSIRSLQIARMPSYKAAHATSRPICWKFRFRRDKDADTGLGGVLVFQTF